MGGPKAVGILLFVVVIGLIVFVAQSGIFSNLKGISLPKFGFSSSTRLGSAPNRPPNYGSSISAPTPTPTSTNVTSIPINPSDIPAGFTADQLSVNFHKVRLSTSRGYVYTGSPYFSLSVYYSPNAAPINVTGWYIKAVHGGQYIPRAVYIYDPSGLSAETDMFLGSGDTANFYPLQSPMGVNLRMNKCIGYLSNSSKFTPALPNNCPRPTKNEISSFSGACQDYISSLGSCSLPKSNPPIPQYDYACQSFLNTLNYKGCFDKYRADTDFIGHEVRVWIGPVSFLDTRHDKVDLFDREGKLVDEYVY